MFHKNDITVKEIRIEDVSDFKFLLLLYLSLSLSLSLSLGIYLSLSLSLALPHSFFLSLSLSYSLSFIHTHVDRYIRFKLRGAFNTFPDFFVQAFKIVVYLENSICHCYTSYEMTDQFLWFQVQMNSYNRNWNTPY